MASKPVTFAAAILFAAPFCYGQGAGPAEVHLKAGFDYLQAGAATKAVAELKAAVALDPQSAAAHMLLGQAYLGQRSVTMVAEAKAELQQALDLDPTLLWARFYLARVYIDLGRYDRAKQELEQGLSQRPGVPHFLALLGEVERKLGNPEKALDLNRKALAADPSMTPAHYHIALVYMDQGKEQEAMGELESAVDSKFVAPEMLLTLGSIYTRRQRYREAEAVCRKAIALDPERPEGYLRLAQLFNAQRMSTKALAALKQAVPEGTSFPTSAYYQQLQADVFFERGRAYQMQGQLKEAVSAYLQSLELDPNRGETHERLAELYRRQGDTASALLHEAAAHKASASEVEKQP